MLYEDVMELGRCSFTSTKKMKNEDWLKLRQTGIGGSEAGAIMGLSKYATPLTVYMSKVNPVEEFSNNFTRWGHAAEIGIREQFKSLYDGLKVQEVKGMFSSVDNPFINANLDGLIYAKKPVVINEIKGEDNSICGLVGLEIKTFNSNNNEFKDDEIPDTYYCQVQHYMYVTGLSCFILLAMKDAASGIIAYKINRNDEFIENLIDTEVDFWNKYVLAKVAPSPVGNEYESSLLNNLIEDAPEEIELTEEFETKCIEYKDYEDQIKVLKAKQELIKEEFKIEIGKHRSGSVGDSSKVVCKVGNSKVTWQKQTSKRVDTDLLKKSGLYDNYTKLSESLVMRITSKAS